MENTEIELQDDLRAFYEREERMRRIWHRLIVGSVWLLAAGAVVWIYFVVSH